MAPRMTKQPFGRPGSVKASALSRSIASIAPRAVRSQSSARRVAEPSVARYSAIASRNSATLLPKAAYRLGAATPIAAVRSAIDTPS
jgi:hypothetical protein